MARLMKRQLEAPRNQALGDAGRAQQKHALAGQGRQQTEPQGILALVKPLAEGRQQAWQPFVNGGETKIL
ncbi:hypothetical protein VAWG003_06570 [Aeromonas dhakensis]|nr:hypothetical protein VAWG003_06570 [Aeromonas dhakensis]